MPKSNLKTVICYFEPNEESLFKDAEILKAAALRFRMT